MEEKPAEQNPQPPVISAVPEAPKPLAEELIDIDHFMKVKLRVARVEAAEAVPKSSKLLKLQLDLGPLGKRQILAGVAKFYTPEQMLGRKIIVVANLQPAKLMGLESQGMLLAASSEDGSQLVLADPGQNMPEGSVVR